MKCFSRLDWDSALRQLHFYLAWPPKSVICADTTTKEKALYTSSLWMRKASRNYKQKRLMTLFTQMGLHHNASKQWINQCVLKSTVLRISSNDKTSSTISCLPLEVIDEDFSFYDGTFTKVFPWSLLLYLKEETYHHFVNQLHWESKSKLSKVKLKICDDSPTVTTVEIGIMRQLSINPVNVFCSDTM